MTCRICIAVKRFHTEDVYSSFSLFLIKLNVSSLSLSLLISYFVFHCVQVQCHYILSLVVIAIVNEIKCLENKEDS